MTFTIKLHERTARGPAQAHVYDEAGNLAAHAAGRSREDFTEAVLLDAVAQARGARHLGLKAYVNHLRQPAMPEEGDNG